MCSVTSLLGLASPTVGRRCLSPWPGPPGGTAGECVGGLQGQVCRDTPCAQGFLLQKAHGSRWSVTDPRAHCRGRRSGVPLGWPWSGSEVAVPVAALKHLLPQPLRPQTREQGLWADLTQAQSAMASTSRGPGAQDTWLPTSPGLWARRARGACEASLRRGSG